MQRLWHGFCRGLKAAYDTQDARHQEWGRALAVPQEMKDSMSDMGKPLPYVQIRTDGWRTKYAAAGFVEGKELRPHPLSGGWGEKAG